MDLFDFAQQKQQVDRPLASRLRPQTLDDVVGQEHILGPGKLLRRAIEADRLTPMIFYGPPGTGKTTLAKVIANRTKALFEQINAVTCGVQELRKLISEAEERLKYDQMRTVLFIDEIYHFNKA